MMMFLRVLSSLSLSDILIGRNVLCFKNDVVLIRGPRAHPLRVAAARRALRPVLDCYRGNAVGAVRRVCRRSFSRVASAYLSEMPRWFLALRHSTLPCGCEVVLAYSRKEAPTEEISGRPVRRLRSRSRRAWEGLSLADHLHL